MHTVLHCVETIGMGSSTLAIFPDLPFPHLSGSRPATPQAKLQIQPLACLLFTASMVCRLIVCRQFGQATQTGKGAQEKPLLTLIF